MKNKIITRFPPSPTGNFHIGSARTALFNYLFAKQNNGTFLVRFEDTDLERSEKKYEDDILEGLRWLGVGFDEKPSRQTEQTKTYKKHIDKLIKDGNVYKAEGSETGKGKVLRFKNPNKKIAWEDLIRGKVLFDTAELGDFVIARNMDEPLYHLAAVVDDAENNITHVIRGEDHISNTPRQILIQEALGVKQPIYAHLPLILSKDRSKLSKRRDSVSVNEYRKEGYLPEAFVNYLGLLGWHPKDDNQEIFTLDELIKTFDLLHVQKGGAIFDREKLNWINKQHMENLSDTDFKEGLLKHIPEKYNTEILDKILPLLRERVSVFSEAAKEDLDFYYARPDYDAGSLIWKDSDKEYTKKHLSHVKDTLESLQYFSHDAIKEVLWDYATKKGKGNVLWPLRYALSGKEKSPDPFVIAEVLGKDEVLARLKIALGKLS